MYSNLNIKKNLQSSQSQPSFYYQDYLSGNTCNSSTFLREISYQVNLTELYKVIGSCYLNAQMEFCPVLVQINHTLLKKEYGAEYLLQVWDRQGQKVYQRPLKSKDTYFRLIVIIRSDKDLGCDDDFDCYHLVNLKNGNSTLLIKDCINDPTCGFIAYSHEVLYIANKSTIFLINSKHSIEHGEVKRIDLSNRTENVQRIVPGLNIHGLFNYHVQRTPFFKSHIVVVALETSDNQLDFSQVFNMNIGTPSFKYQLRQQRELVGRDVKIDPIQKFQFIIDSKNTFYGISLRQSGHCDLYWDMTLVDSPPEGTINSRIKSYLLDLAKDVSLSFDEIYMHMKTDNSIRGIACTGPSITFEQSDVESEDFEFSIIFYQNIKNHVHLFGSFSLIRTTLYVVHGPFISLYDIRRAVWLKHAKFLEGDICKLVKKMTLRKGKETSPRDEQEKLELAAILMNGSIYMNIQSLIFSEEKLKQTQDATTQSSVQPLQYVQSILNIDSNFKYQNDLIQGELIKVAEDQQRNEWCYIMMKQEMQKVGEEPSYLVRLFVMHYDEIYEIKEGIEDPIDIFTSFVHVFSPSEEAYLVLQKHSQVMVYHLTIGKPPTTDFEELTPLGNEVKDTVIAQCILQDTIRNVAGSFHSSMTTNIQDHIFFVDERHIYLYNIVQKQSKTYKDQNCVGLFVVDNKFCYTLSHSSGDKSSGLRLYDINNILSKDTDVSYLLQNVQVGFAGVIDWNQDYSRFSILKSLDCLTILPALHRNTIAFIGMSKRQTYLATKVIKDKFIALDNKNQLLCWNITTGKLNSVHRLPTRQDYSRFSIFSSPKDDPYGSAYHREWMQKILLVKNDREIDFDENSFYKNEGVIASAHNQVSYAQIQKKEFREYRLIEIVSDIEVKEHLVFIHPFYFNDKQRIYFDSKNQYMLEKLGHPRVFLYEKEENRMRRTIKWRCIRRFSKYPEELENDSGFLRALSPSFQNLVDVNRKDNLFVIRDTFSNRVICTVPKDLMDLNLEPASEIMNRFKWVDDETIKIINHEGIEKIVYLRGMELIEIEYNVIPLFDNHEIKSPLRHYYTNKSQLSVWQVKERLIRKYQAYKSGYYLEHKQDAYGLYPDVFTVDYQVDHCKGMHVADMSFTFLHWKMMEQLEKKALQIELVDNSQIELLLYNILPQGNTILHKLSANGDVIKKLFHLAHPNEENVKEIHIHVPFLQNLNGESPLHICKKQQDIRTMDTMLTYLAGYGIDHHSRALIELMPIIIEKQLPSLLPYLDSRLVQTRRLEKITKGCLKKNSLGICESKIWFNYDDVEKKLMETRKEGDESMVERPIRVQFVDLPNVYHYDDPICDEFFGQLADTDQYDVFARKGIQKMIEFNYPLVKSWTIKRLFVPFVMFQVTLFVYLNVIFKQPGALIEKIDFPMQILLGLFSCYFLQNELFQMRTEGLNYFSSIWNYIDIVTPSTIMTVVCINAFNIHMDDESERVLQAIGVFFMWFKFLYFFRIFKNFGYLTRLIIIVINDMKTFLFVMFFTIIAFSDSLLTLSNGNKEGERFVHGFGDSIIYTYRIILGDFDVKDFHGCGTELVYALFIMCTVFNTIVMLNLLIAIISETFSMVKENASNAAYQEMASMIAENSYLIPDRIKQSYAEKNRNLMIVTDLENEMEDDSDEWKIVINRIEQVKKNMLNKMSHINKDVKKISRHTEAQQIWQEMQDFRTNQILNNIEKLQNQRMDNDIASSRLETDSVLGGMFGSGNQTQTNPRMTMLIKRTMQNNLSNKVMGLMSDKRNTLLQRKKPEGSDLTK
ncbi:wd-40 repeat protein [Stylonychia lemnae]|uniref:Wd-40 repeat protein n=1 Tax=Stylonychia lemnae TaxID=5949 RepID=A0A077ZPI4_STYLE|nr:wd-40 repeat protein [Stylonychia lemnae]|eukprot:CDW71887.1 wd-40 repeat protein [Stylonychia lemnae]